MMGEAPGGVSLPTMPFAGFRAQMSGAQVVAADSTVQVQFSVEDFDVGDYYDTGTYRWTPAAGHVTVGCGIEYSTGDNEGFRVIIRKNGADLANILFRNRCNSAITGSNLCITTTSDGDDYFEAFTRHSNGAGANVQDTVGTRFWGFMVPAS
jgi:hypothetical protein